MTEYHITWEIDLTADNPEDAARQALAIQRDPHIVPTVFDVNDCDEFESVKIDLDDLDAVTS